MTVTVILRDNSLSIFNGPEVDYRIEENGDLVVIDWITGDEIGETCAFAAGIWARVQRTKKARPE